MTESTEDFFEQIPADHEVPWAMQIALRHDKQHPAARVDACEAAARAVVSLLASTEAREGEWRAAVDYWRDGRIRKLVRRARGKRWDDVQALPGVTIDQGRAAARAFVPGPARPLPPALDKLQVSGTELPDEQTSHTEGAMVLVGVSPLVEMTTGKACAQCGHAAQLAWEAMTETERDRWQADDFRLRVETIAEARWASDVGRVQVVDAGFTEFEGPTETTRAWW